QRLVAAKYRMVVVRGHLKEHDLRALRKLRPGIEIIAYEQSGALSSDEVAAVEPSHPDWIAHDEAGNRIHPASFPDFTLGDITIPAFRGWKARRMAAEVALGADGTFIDTLGAYFPDGFYSGRPWVHGGAVTDVAWRHASVDLIAQVKARTGKLVIANGFG